jgi:hypothetical protein
MTFDLVSPLPLAECVRRLREATDSSFAIAGSKPVLGTVRETAVRLRRRSYYRQSSQCWLSGKFVEDGGLTRLHCTVGMHPVMRTLLEYWVGAVALAGGYVFLRSLRLFFNAHGALPDPWPDYLWLGLVVPPLLLGFGAVLLAFGDHNFGSDPRFLVEFVARTIDGKEVWYRGRDKENKDPGSQDAHPL